MLSGPASLQSRVHSVLQAGISNRLASQTSELEEQQRHAVSLQFKLDEQQAKTEQLQAELAAKAQDLVTVQGELAEASKAVSELSEGLQAHAELVNELKAECRARGEKAVQLQQALEQCQQQQRHDAAQVEAVREHAEQLEGSYQQLSSNQQEREERWAEAQQVSHHSVASAHSADDVLLEERNSLLMRWIFCLIAGLRPCTEMHAELPPATSQICSPSWVMSIRVDSTLLPLTCLEAV